MVAGHAVLSRLICDGALVRVPVPADERRTGAELVHYGGDIAEPAPTVALVTT